MRRHIGDVMGVDFYQDEDGYVFMNDACILTDKESPQQFCSQLLDLLTRKSPAEELAAALQAFVDEDKKFLSRKHVLDLLITYRDRVDSETPEGDE